jgi:hypothetical protein
VDESVEHGSFGPILGLTQPFLSFVARREPVVERAIRLVQEVWIRHAARRDRELGNHDVVRAPRGCRIAFGRFFDQILCHILEGANRQ